MHSSPVHGLGGLALARFLRRYIRRKSGRESLARNIPRFFERPRRRRTNYGTTSQPVTSVPPFFFFGLRLAEERKNRSPRNSRFSLVAFRETCKQEREG